MGWFFGFLNSSIGKKVQMAATGLLLCGFLVAHLAGNLFIYKSPEAFNGYAGALEANPVLPALELGLLLLFLLHAAMAVRVRCESYRARPTAYAVRASAGGRTWGSATMALSGLVLLVFLVIHVKTFRFASEAQERAGLYNLVVLALSNKLRSSFYVVAMAALALHLSHGFQSGLRTLGLEHPKYTPLLRGLGLAFAAAVSIGFASIPIWAGFLQQGCCG